MTSRTAELFDALRDIRERLQAKEQMTREATARAHKMARKGYKGHGAGREWTDSIIRNHRIGG